MKLTSQSLQIGPMGSQGIQGPPGPGVLTLSLKVLSAELLALNGAPKLLVAAPGVGMEIVPTSARFSANGDGLPYTSAGPTDALDIQYTTSGNSIFQLGATADLLAWPTPRYQAPQLAWDGQFARSINQGLQLVAPDNPLLVGTLTMTISLAYMLVSL